MENNKILIADRLGFLPTSTLNLFKMLNFNSFIYINDNFEIIQVIKN
jgi:hypothetical protein